MAGLKLFPILVETFLNVRTLTLFLPMLAADMLLRLLIKQIKEF